MSEEYIEEGINGQWTDWKFEAENYKKICEHLQQENQQLKEENERYRKLGFKYLNEQNNQLKEVIEQIKISVSTSKYAYEEGYQIDDAVLDDILQILDKIKENK